jgi:hypothetical protein
MSNSVYRSKHSGAYIDEAVDLVYLLNTEVHRDYIPKEDINITVAGLQEGIINRNCLPLATKDSTGIISVGNGLVIDTAGCVKVDTSLLYTQEDVNILLSGKLDVTEKPERLSELTNDLITIEKSANSDVYGLHIIT